ncbi:MAG: hypothetical protein HY596_00650 [Candidatus Omnitrophica bacterium]|nr:hypothetical protein [Candidatus Omnitrophota bacterium]
MNIDTLEHLLSTFQIGASTAENDPLLEKAQINTQQFDDLFFQDRIDLVRGVKGAGKTALYRVLFLLKDWAFEKKKLLMTFGVEPQGDPLFKTYSGIFDELNERTFESFWYGYFVYLSIQALVEKAPELPSLDPEGLNRLKSYFGSLCGELFGEQLTIAERITRWGNVIKSVGVSVKVKTKLDGETTYEPEVKWEPKEAKAPEIPEIDPASKQQLSELAQKAGIRIWILLDRLDEVFFRRTDTETRGLRALLRAYYRFSGEQVRVKLFMREDIFETIAAGGFTALTHVGDRSSKAMSWTDGELLYLVTKRLGHMKQIASFFDIDPEKLEGNAEYQRECFYKVFPAKIGKQSTFEWLVSSLKDGKDQTTPRDLIDLLNNARNEQLQILKMEKCEQKTLIEERALRRAFDVLSKDKRDKYLFAEFPHLQDDILLFRGGYSDYAEASIEKKLGGDWRIKVENLRSIGFLKFDAKKAIWKVPIIWRKGLDVRRGRA